MALNAFAFRLDLSWNPEIFSARGLRGFLQGLQSSKGTLRLLMHGFQPQASLLRGLGTLQVITDLVLRTEKVCG